MSKEQAREEIRLQKGVTAAWESEANACRAVYNDPRIIATELRELKKQASKIAERIEKLEMRQTDPTASLPYEKLARDSHAKAMQMEQAVKILSALKSGVADIARVTRLHRLGVKRRGSKDGKN